MPQLSRVSVPEFLRMEFYMQGEERDIGSVFTAEHLQISLLLFRVYTLEAIQDFLAWMVYKGEIQPIGGLPEFYSLTQTGLKAQEKARDLRRSFVKKRVDDKVQQKSEQTKSRRESVEESAQMSPVKFFQSATAVQVQPLFNPLITTGPVSRNDLARAFCSVYSWSVETVEDVFSECLHTLLDRGFLELFRSSDGRILYRVIEMKPVPPIAENFFPPAPKCLPRPKGVRPTFKSHPWYIQPRRPLDRPEVLLVEAPSPAVPVEAVGEIQVPPQSLRVRARQRYKAPQTSPPRRTPLIASPHRLREAVDQFEAELRIALASIADISNSG